MRGRERTQKERIHGDWSDDLVGRRKEDGSWGWEKEGMSASISTTSFLSLPLFFLFNTFSPPPSSYFQPTACMRAWVCMCVLEVRFGAGAIKALLKHFWCCWLMLKLKGEWRKRQREEVRRGGSAHTQWLSGPTQQSTGSLSILWAQRCEMSQQPNSNIKLSWAAEGKSGTQWRCLLLTLSPSPDLHSSKPFKIPLKNQPLLHAHTHTAASPSNTHAVALLKFWPAAELHLERFSKI